MLDLVKRSMERSGPVHGLGPSPLVENHYFVNLGPISLTAQQVLDVVINAIALLDPPEMDFSCIFVFSSVA